MLTLQKYTYGPISMLVVPGSWIVTKVESGLTFVGQRLWAVRTDNRSVEELSNRVKQLEDTLAVSQQTEKELRERLKVLDPRTHPGILIGDRLAANITGRNPGVGTNLINIDKGGNDGVRGLPELMPVIANSCIVGRVSVAYPMTASVLLLTDTHSAVRAKIVKRADRSVVVETCLVEGAGNGQLICKSVEKSAIKAQVSGGGGVDVGDLVELVDSEWPVQLRNFMIGVVAERPRSGDNPYRYSIWIKPSVNVTELQSVDVLVRW